MAEASNATNQAQAAKKSKGRQKIKIKRIEDAKSRSVAYSKRKASVYSKANKLVTLAGAEVAVGIFSESGRPYAFATPLVEKVTHRFLEWNDDDRDSTDPDHKKAIYDEQVELFKELLVQLGQEQEIKKELEEKEKEIAECCRINEISEFTLDELDVAIDNLKLNHGEIIEMIKENSNGAGPSGTN